MVIELKKRDYPLALNNGQSQNTKFSQLIMSQKITSDDLKDILVILQDIAMNQALIEGAVKILQTGENYDLVIRILKAYLWSEPEGKLQKITSLLHRLKLIMSIDEINEQIDSEYKAELEMFELTKDLWK